MLPLIDEFLVHYVVGGAVASGGRAEALCDRPGKAALKDDFDIAFS